MSPDEITIILLNESEPLVFACNRVDTAEYLCFEATRRCSIGPVARHLFALRRPDSTWVNPGSVLGNECSYELRLRFQVPDVGELQNVDGRAMDYYFHQIRHDFLSGFIPEALEIQDKMLGLAVTDMFRVIQETGSTRVSVERDYKKYLPKDTVKNVFMAQSIKNAMHESLIDLESGTKDPEFMKVQYVNQLNELAPNYGREEYDVLVEKERAFTQVEVAFEPFNKEKPGLWMYTKTKKKVLSQHVCTIEELCFISMRNDDTVEISRKNGIPQYFRFNSTPKMRSFIGVLDGYYRLMEKWTFNLCKEFPTPFLQTLRVMKCHGPVGRRFSYDKLSTKRKNAAGCYILRQGWQYDTYRLDLCLENNCEPQTLAILHTANGYRFEDLYHADYFVTINDLLLFYNNKFGGNLLKECIPPSEYDDSPLLLCKIREADSQGSRESGLEKKEPGVSTAQCIDFRQVDLLKLLEPSNRYTAVVTGVWQRGGRFGRLPVALKTLIKSKHEASKIEEFLKMANTCLFWHCESIVTFYGMTLVNPLALVMEHLPLGSLDVFLQRNSDDIQEVDLVEAAVYLGKALWYLEEQGVIHGNICCRNLLVVSHDESSFKIKLADPGIIPSMKNRIHWIPPECYGDTALARSQFSTDVWAFGTTLWEIFSYGQAPVACSSFTDEVMMFYQCGGQLQCPKDCNVDVYKLMGECWCIDPDARKKPQAIVRDINQILYEVHNSRLNNQYDHLQPQCSSSASCSISGTLNISSQPTTPMTLNTLNERPLISNGILPAANGNRGAITREDVREQLSQLSLSSSNSSLESMEQDESSMWLIEMSQLEKKDRLGQGFYGEVHRALLTRWSGLGQEEVAVKQLRANLDLGYNDLKREIAIMKSLQHKNIVEIKGVVEDPQTLLVMEYVPLGSMLVYIKTHKERLTDKILLKFSLDIAEGMEYLDHKRIVHRDLAARNILVATKDTVKISDFGLAQKIGTKNYYSLKTNRDLPVRWYAPETLRMWKFTSKSDVWSFGITLFEMFSYGKEPIIEGCKDDELLKALDEGKRLGCPSTCSSRIYAHLMMRCWEGVSEQRPSFTQLLVEIKDLYDNAEQL